MFGQWRTNCSDSLSVKNIKLCNMLHIGEESSGSQCEADLASVWVEIAYQLWIIGITMHSTGVAFDNAIQIWKEETVYHNGKTNQC